MTITVNTDTRPYDIVLERGSTLDAPLELDRRVLIVTDSGVPSQYAERIAARCREAHIFTIPAGEGSKSMENFQRLLSEMLGAGFTRRDCAVAVGGGVVGDLTGFAAACYMRGIDFYNIPTTLLSQVDSSIGGKTAVDLGGVKNAVGAFYQPKKVIIDPSTLSTLDERQLRCGLAEAVKMALTCDGELFELIEKGVDTDIVIERSLLIKKKVVEADPKENGLRRVLNFGHTIGHAVESFNGGALLHGECVALGMLPMCSPPVRERLKRTLEKQGLPTVCEQSADELMPYIMHDKKMGDGKITAVYVENAGEFEFMELTTEQLRGYMEEAR